MTASKSRAPRSADPIPRRIVPSAVPSERSARSIEREFRALLDGGTRLVVVGAAKKQPRRLFSLGYVPRYKIELFDTAFYMARVRQNPDIRFFVAYVAPGGVHGTPKTIYARIFYKDISLVWRSASHFIHSDQENWIGKGDVRTFNDGEHESVVSAEETSDLPLELQSALETLSRKARRVQRDDVAPHWVLRRGPDHRIAPYRDFTEPRRRAMADPRNRINGGRSIARFTRKNDPTSLRFVAGYEPDFDDGVLEVAHSMSRLYRGRLARYRILSRNRRVQYLFFAGPHHVWIIPPQATTTELMSYGVRTVDVIEDEDLCIPGFEYHFVDESEDPPELVSQIPPGFVGPVSEFDDSRCDASPWLDHLPVVREFRRKVLRRRGRG